MTAHEIINLAGFHVDDVITPTGGGLDWLNEGLNYLSLEAGLHGSFTLNAKPGQLYKLPNDCLRVTKVKEGRGVVEGFEVLGTVISFAAPGTYEIVYRRLANTVARADEVPGVPRGYHPVLALFIASRFLQSIGEVQRSAAMLGEFDAGVGRIKRASKQATVKAIKVYR